MKCRICEEELQEYKEGACKICYEIERDFI